MNKEIIDSLIDLSVIAFNNKATPHDYARTAAHKAATITASKYDPELGDVAALIGATSLLTEIADTILFSSKIADAATTKMAANIAYDSSFGLSIANTIAPISITNYSYLTMADSACKVIRAFSDSVTPTYETTSVLNYTKRNKAKCAALYVYSDTYAASRAAFIRACFVVKEISDNQMKIDKFKSTMADRLNRDLTYDIIQAGFILNCMSSKTFQVIASIILLLGICAILFAVYHVTSIPFTPLVIAGSASLVVGSGLFISGFFAQKRCQDILEQNENRIEESIY